MKPYLQHWRCMCGEVNNPADALVCNKCRQLRWSQLGFTLQQSIEALCAIHPSVKPGTIRY